MGRTTRNRHDTRALRVLGLLAVLLGLLAMHGLASSHHAPASAAEHAAAEQSAAGSLAHEQGAARDHHNADPVAATQQSSELPASPAGSSCEQECPGAVFALCVAVLAATAALAAAVVVLRRRRRDAGESAPAGVVRAPASARSAFPPPDPVRELCVSRT